MTAGIVRLKWPFATAIFHGVLMMLIGFSF
jgi:hypothetical protein